jgi:hypothetical protein
LTIFAELPGAYTSNRYLRIGHFIGIAASIPTFLAGWAIAISTTGFFIGNYILESRSYRFRPSRRACDGNEQIAKRFGRGRCFFPRESALVPILSPLVIEADLMRPAQA